MQFLADESCDFAVVRSLKDAGHDVVAVAEILRGASDEVVIDLAASKRRILITEDKDFGQVPGLLSNDYEANKEKGN